MGPIWRVRMLGDLQAESADTSINRFRTRRVGLLLAYLATYQDRSHSREELADMLWPELEPEHAKRNLRQALSSLRRHLEPPGIPAGAVLDTRQSLVSLNPEYLRTDVAEFVRHIREGSLERAIELYRGDLLPGFYEEWVQRERLHLEDQYVSALQGAILVAETDRRFEDAIRFVRLALGKDGLREDLHASLIRLYLAAGRPQSAVQQFEEWQAISLNELKCEPDPALAAMVSPVRRIGETKANTLVPIPELVFAVSDEPTSPVSKLPVQLTRFFGRNRELEHGELAIAARRTRLLTLIGPAGTGKTRISIEIGRAMVERFGWNVWFVPLADISDGANLIDATLNTLKIGEKSGDPIEALAARLSGDRNLIILDNLEHILEAAVSGVEALLNGLPNVSLIVTSRQSLKLNGEQEVDLATLPIPAPEDAEAATLTDLASVPSVQLFVDRARLVLPDFQLTAHNARAIAEICKRLDGLPLALEIAASLSGAFSPHQLLQNLENRLELLRSRRRDLSSRHRSLRAAIDYSYNLLTEEQQAFFVRLSVFRGGFTIDAASQVSMDSSHEGSQSRKSKSVDCLRMILDLQERSLLRADEAREDSPARFRLLESYREYAREYLDAEEERELAQRHADYFLRQALSGGTPTEDRDNRNAAVRFFFEQRQVHECVSLLGTFEVFSGPGQIVSTLARDPDFETFRPDDQVSLLRLLADLYLHRLDSEEALRTCRHAAELAERYGLEYEVSLCNRKLSLILVYLNRRLESIEVSRQELARGIEKGDLRAIEYASTNIGVNHWALGEFEDAYIAYERAYRASVELHHGEVFWPVLYNLSLVTLDLGRLDDGLYYANEGIRRAQANDEEFGVSLCMSLIGRYHLYKGNLHAALATSYGALMKRRNASFMYWSFQAIFFHAMVLMEMGMLYEAAVLFGATRVVAKVNTREADLWLGRLRNLMPPDEFERAWAEGLAMNFDQAFRYAARFK